MKRSARRRALWLLSVSIFLASCGASHSTRGSGPGPVEAKDTTPPPQLSPSLVPTKAASTETPRAASQARTKNGYSAFTPGPDSVVIYVSSSTGSDESDGRSPQQAVKSLKRGAALVRDGFPDFLLLKRGDEFQESLGRFKSGRDKAHPLVVSSFGDENQKRPRILLDDHFIDHAGKVRSHVAIVGLEFLAKSQDPRRPGFSGHHPVGLRFVGGGRNLLVEDCHFKYGEIIVQSYKEARYENVHIRRNVIERTYHADTCEQKRRFRPSGIYASHVQGLVLEENLLDHNGWNPEEVKSACATMYNHNMYLNANDLVVRGNILARASSMGIKMRSDSTGEARNLLFENNLFIDGEIGLSIGGNKSDEARFINVIIRDNVFSEIGRSNPTGRNFSWMLDVEDNQNTEIVGNRFLFQPWFERGFGIRVRGDFAEKIRIADNLFFGLKSASLRLEPSPHWKQVLIESNQFAATESSACLISQERPHHAVTFRDNEYQGSQGGGWFCLDKRKVDLATWKAEAKESDAQLWQAKPAGPSRTVASYAKSIGLSGTFEAFLEAAQLQSRTSYKPELTAAQVNQYLRAGFE